MSVCERDISYLFFQKQCVAYNILHKALQKHLVYELCNLYKKLFNILYIFLKLEHIFCKCIWYVLDKIPLHLHFHFPPILLSFFGTGYIQQLRIAFFIPNRYISLRFCIFPILFFLKFQVRIEHQYNTSTFF